MTEARNDTRCRLCTTNDIDALIEDLAEKLWDSRRQGTLDDFPSAQASEHWKQIFRQLAATAVDALHPHR